MRLQLAAPELDAPQGLEIGVIGFKSSPAEDQTCPTQVYVEIYEGKLRVCVWNGSSEDPVAIHLIDPLPE